MVKEKEIIIADASPLIAFGKIKRISLLTDLFSKLMASQTVAEECISDLSLPGAKEIYEAINNGVITVTTDPDRTEEYQDVYDILGKGEATAIVLAKKLNFGVLIDERLGRQIAHKMELKVIGTAGVLLIAKQNGLIKAVHPLLEELRKSGYFFSYCAKTSFIFMVLSHSNFPSGPSGRKVSLLSSCSNFFPILAIKSCLTQHF